jgi:hypothetical protein
MRSRTGRGIAAGPALKLKARFTGRAGALVLTIGQPFTENLRGTLVAMVP